MKILLIGSFVVMGISILAAWISSRICESAERRREHGIQWQPRNDARSMARK